MKLAVFGNRDIDDNKAIIASLCEEIEDTKISVYLHGGAIGPQNIVANFFEGLGDVRTILFKPWHMLGFKIDFHPDLFYFRNKQIIDNADYVLIFTNGKKDSEVDRVLNLVIQNNIPHKIIEVK